MFLILEKDFFLLLGIFFMVYIYLIVFLFILKNSYDSGFKSHYRDNEF